MLLKILPQRLYLKSTFVKIGQKVTKWLSYFERKFVSENFQKSPNMVTLNSTCSIQMQAADASAEGQSSCIEWRIRNCPYHQFGRKHWVKPVKVGDWKVLHLKNKKKQILRNCLPFSFSLYLWFGIRRNHCHHICHPFQKVEIFKKGLKRGLNYEDVQVWIWYNTTLSV